MNNVFDAYWKEAVEDSVSGFTVEPVLKITCEGLSPCIRWSVWKTPMEFCTMYTFTLYIGLPVLCAAAASSSPSCIIIMAYNLSHNDHTKYG